MSSQPSCNTRNHRRALPLLLLALISTHAFADDAVEAHIARIAKGLRPPVSIAGDATWSIEERMQHYGVPGVTITVIDADGIAWTRVYGKADRDAGTPVKTDTLFMAGSVSKPVSAYAAIRLVQDGKLDLQQPVNAQLKSWQIPENEFTKKVPVTLAHLLSHTGGLTVHGFAGYAAGEPVPSVVSVLDGKLPANSAPVRVDQLPGSAWRYSGGGYTVVQLLMTDVTGLSFPSLMQQRVLGPIGMRDSTYSNPLPSALLPRAAAGVSFEGNSVPGKHHTYPEMAAAGLWTTSQDMARFVLEMQQALHGKSPLLSASMARAMLTSRNDSDYGYGFAVPVIGGERYFAHGGDDAGFSTLMMGTQDLGKGVVIMINSNQREFMNELQQAVAFEYQWPGFKTHARLPASTEVLEKAPGRYRVNAEQVARVVREGDRLYLEYAGDGRSELVPVGDNRYLQREVLEARSFQKNDQGQLVLQLEQPGKQAQTLPRLADDQRLPRELLLAGDHDAALAAYRALQESKDRAGSEDYLNRYGFDLVTRGHVDAGLALLAINTELYPASANTWDSLGYAYLAKGDKHHARENYQKALSIDPNFPSAKAALAELGD